jgi:hypothetical protein
VNAGYKCVRGWYRSDRCTATGARRRTGLACAAYAARTHEKSPALGSRRAEVRSELGSPSATSVRTRIAITIKYISRLRCQCSPRIDDSFVCGSRHTCVSAHGFKSHFAADSCRRSRGRDSRISRRDCSTRADRVAGEHGKRAAFSREPTTTQLALHPEPESRFLVGDQGVRAAPEPRRLIDNFRHS